MRPTLRLGRVAGIEIGVHWSLLVVGALLVSSLAGSLLPDLQPDAGGSYWAAAVIAVAAFFASILAHELAHSLVAVWRGQRVEGITLWLLGGVARLRDEARDARGELLVAIAGPLTSFVLGGAFVGLAVALDAALDEGSLLPTVAAWLGVVNIVLAAFNLLPGAPLDGGRVLTAAIWAWRGDRRRAQVASARAGQVVGWLLVAAPLVAYATGTGFASIWTAMVGWFVVEASRAEEGHARLAGTLEGRTVADLMTPHPPRVHDWAEVGQLAALVPDRPRHVLLVDWSGTPRALLETPLLARAPRDARVRDVAIPLARLATLPPDAPAHDALTQGLPLLVVDDGTVVGVVGVDELQDSQGSVRSR
jgi:Zn-dependent protease